MRYLGVDPATDENILWIFTAFKDGAWRDMLVSGNVKLQSPTAAGRALASELCAICEGLLCGDIDKSCEVSA